MAVSDVVNTDLSWKDFKRARNITLDEAREFCSSQGLVRRDIDHNRLWSGRICNGCGPQAGGTLSAAVCGCAGGDVLRASVPDDTASGTVPDDIRIQKQYHWSHLSGIIP